MKKIFIIFAILLGICFAIYFISPQSIYSFFPPKGFYGVRWRDSVDKALITLYQNNMLSLYREFNS